MPPRRPPCPAGQRSRLERLRRGVVLALLALFSQSIVALLPMPAMAAAGMALCSPVDGSAPAAPGHDRSTPHSLPDCPVCQAGHLAASLLPATPPAVVLHEAAAGWRPVPTPVAAPVAPVFGPQQARAPPGSV